MILLTGGSGCGKSSFGESLCVKMPMPRYYLAAMKPFGEGSREKIARHREMRKGKGFQTIERYTDYASHFWNVSAISPQTRCFPLTAV